MRPVASTELQSILSSLDRIRLRQPPSASLPPCRQQPSDLEAAASRPGSSCLTSDLEAATASIRRCAPTILRLATAFALVIVTILLVVWDVVFRVGFAA